MITNEQLAEIKDYCAKESELNWLLHALRDRYKHDRKEREAASKELQAYRTYLPLLVAEVERLKADQPDVAQLMLDVAAWKDLHCNESEERQMQEAYAKDLLGQLSAAQKRISDAKELLKKARYYQTADCFDKLEAVLSAPPTPP